LQSCLDAVRHHHEKLDGSGYPDGIKGEEISIDARIIAVADIFDALYSDRPYRSKMSINMVWGILQDEVQKGCLDSKVVEALLELERSGKLAEIY
jgi:putative two-component system response regulator